MASSCAAALCRDRRGYGTRNDPDRAPEGGVMPPGRVTGSNGSAADFIAEANKGECGARRCRWPVPGRRSSVAGLLRRVCSADVLTQVGVGADLGGGCETTTRRGADRRDIGGRCPGRLSLSGLTAGSETGHEGETSRAAGPGPVGAGPAAIVIDGTYSPSVPSW